MLEVKTEGLGQRFRAFKSRSSAQIRPVRRVKNIALFAVLPRVVEHSKIGVVGKQAPLRDDVRPLGDAVRCSAQIG